VNRPAGETEALSGELALDEHRRILDEIAAAGCLSLLITGGEPLLRRDFLEVFDYAKRRGFLITLFTNGTLITPEIADHLGRYRPYSVEITLYGRTRETFERITGIPGSYERCMSGIRLLLDRRVRLGLKTMAMRANRHEIAAMKGFAEELGVEFRFDALLSPRLDCSRSPLAQRLTPQEVVELDLEDPERFEEMRRFAEDQRPIDLSLRESSCLYTCGGGFRSFSVDPFGRMALCGMAVRDTYDLRAGSFREGWDLFLGELRSRTITRTTKCTGCGIRSLCGACPASSELECGDPEGEVPFLCEVAHLRARALQLGNPRHDACEFCNEDIPPHASHIAASGHGSHLAEGTPRPI
jgi:radical SAM protein with 4Fe4S-binding SPASM domain